jgi:hypothetical protein
MGRLTISVKRLFLRVSSRMPFGRMIGDVYFSVAHLAIPMKMFMDKSPALEWLKELM